jgi:hypothetical protein
MRTPKTLFETPAEWGCGGEVFWLSRCSLERALRELYAGGGPGWERASVQQCRQWYHVEGGVYQEPRSREQRRFRYNRAREVWEPL